MSTKNSNTYCGAVRRCFNSDTAIPSSMYKTLKLKSAEVLQHGETEAEKYRCKKREKVHGNGKIYEVKK